VHDKPSPTAAFEIEPAALVSSMATAVQRLRRMAVALFAGDAALFAAPAPSGRVQTDHDRCLKADKRG
jgi:hypothetical protein